MCRMSDCKEFHVVGPVTQNVRSPNLVRVGGTVHVTVSADEHRPCRRDDAAVVWTRSVK